MADGHSVFAELAAGAAELALLTTYNVDFPTFERVVLPRLRSGHARYVLLMMDATMLAKACADPLSRPHFAGSEYGLLPIRAPGAFHPKLVLRASAKKARLLVGSHNLTASGMGGNLEVTTLLQADEHEPLDAARLVWASARAWATYATLPAEDVEMLFELGERLVPWITEAPIRRHRIVQVAQPHGPALWQTLRDAIPADTERVVVTAPYYDAEGSLLRAIADAVPAAEFAVAVDPQIGNLQRLPKGRSIRAVAVPEGWRAQAGLKSGVRAHAKVFWFRSRSGNHLLVGGSANASASAWLAAPSGRNAEAVTFLRGPEALDAAEALELEGAFQAPELDASAMATMASNASTDADEAPAVALSVYSHGQRLVLSLQPDRGETIESARVWTRSEPYNAVALAPFRGNGSWELDRGSVRGVIHFVEVNLASGLTCRAPVYDVQSLQRHARTDRDLRIETLLNTLRGENPDVSGLLALLDQVLRAREDNNARTGGGSSGGRAQDASTGQDAAQPVADTLLVEHGPGEGGRGGSSRRESPLGDILAMLLERARVHLAPDDVASDEEAEDDDQGYPDDTSVGRTASPLESAMAASATIEDPDRIRGNSHYYLERITKAFVDRRIDPKTKRYLPARLEDVEDAAATLVVMDWLAGAHLRDKDDQRVRGLVPGETAARMLDCAIATIACKAPADFVTDGHAVDAELLSERLCELRAVASRLLLRFGYDRGPQLRKLAAGPDVGAIRRLAICAEAFAALATDLEARDLARKLNAKDGDGAFGGDLGQLWEEHVLWGAALARGRAAAARPIEPAQARSGHMAVFPLRDQRLLVVLSHVEGNKAHVVRGDIADDGLLALVADRVLAIP